MYDIKCFSFIIKSIIKQNISKEHIFSNIVDRNIINWFIHCINDLKYYLNCLWLFSSIIIIVSPLYYYTYIKVIYDLYYSSLFEDNVNVVLLKLKKKYSYTVHAIISIIFDLLHPF
jgi:hypothetical protein